MNTNFYLDGKVTRFLIVALAAASIWGCSGENKNSNSSPGIFSVRIADVPGCTANDLTPFAPVGAGTRITQLPVGQYNYTWGETFIETLSPLPDMKMHLQDNNPNAQNYSGNIVCLTGAVAPFHIFDSGGYLYRFMNITGTQFNFAITRQLDLKSDGTNLTNVLTSDDQTLIMTNAEALAKENQVLAHCHTGECDTLTVYQTGATTYRVILKRVSTGQGITTRFYVRGDYTKIQ